MLKTKKGFTLIELMIVVAIIGILAAIAIPQFAQLISKSQEGATKGNLGTIRSALSIYYGDTEGYYPIVPGSLTVSSKYLQTVPVCNLPKTLNNQGHGTSATFFPTNLQTATAANLDGSPGWAYDNTGQGGSATWGSVVVSCSHSDLRGSTWTSY